MTFLLCLDPDFLHIPTPGPIPSFNTSSLSQPIVFKMCFNIIILYTFFFLYPNILDRLLSEILLDIW